MTKAHKHAELMMQYAQDALETDTPWERWEQEGMGVGMDKWVTMSCNPAWHPHFEYRHKPPTSRERFEEWAAETCLSVMYVAGEGKAYYDAVTDAAWTAWQEADRQAKEGAA